MASCVNDCKKNARKQILNSVINRVMAVNPSNGYAHTVVEASLELRHPDQLFEHQTPAVFLIPTREQRTGGLGGRYDATWSIDLYVLAKNMDVLNMYDLVDEIEDALYGKKGQLPKLQGCNINLIRVVDIAVDGQMLTTENKNAQAVIAIEVQWTHFAFRNEP